MPCSQQSPAKCSQQSTAGAGRAPVKKASARDCLALLSVDFLTKHFKDDEIRKAFAEHEVRFRYDVNAKLKHSVTFVRETVTEHGEREELLEDQVIIVLGKEELVRMVHQYVLNSQLSSIDSPSKGSDGDNEDEIPVPSSSSDSDEPLDQQQQEHDRPQDLLSFVKHISLSYPGASMTLLLTGMAAYFRSQKKKLDESYDNFVRGKKASRRKRKSAGTPSISQQDFMEALVDLQLTAADVVSPGVHVNHYVIEKMSDALTMIACLTRSVAEAPSKKSEKQMSAMDWFAENDKGASVDLKDMSRDCVRLWRKQLEQFPKVSREVADAIIKIYPTPQSLIQTYERLDDAAGCILLQDVRVGKNNRRLGPDISRKVFLFFTSSDGETFLGNDM